MLVVPVRWVLQAHCASPLEMRSLVLLVASVSVLELVAMVLVVQ